jgi:4-methyl-5(b-hydroxyethyl)-thiazole monophosphate biosynthesis
MSAKPSALVILANGFEEIEAVAPINILRRGGVNVTVAALHSSLSVSGKQQLTLQADTLLDAAQGGTYSCLVLPGGPGTQALLEDTRVLDLVRRFYAQQAWIGAICAAPLVLHKAGVLDGKHYTAHFSVCEILTHIQLNKPVIVDAPLITANGPGAALVFGLELLHRLTTSDLASQVATSLCLTSYNPEP